MFVKTVLAALAPTLPLSPPTANLFSLAVEILEGCYTPTEIKGLYSIKNVPVQFVMN